MYLLPLQLQEAREQRTPEAEQVASPYFLVAPGDDWGSLLILTLISELLKNKLRHKSLSKNQHKSAVPKWKRLGTLYRLEFRERVL